MCGQEAVVGGQSANAAKRLKVVLKDSGDREGALMNDKARRLAKTQKTARKNGAFAPKFSKTVQPTLT